MQGLVVSYCTLSRNIHWKFPKFLVNSNFELRMFGIPCTFADLRSSLADINECDSNPCVNNGTCNDRINGFNCSCPPGFNGSRCEKGNHNCMLFTGENLTVGWEIIEFLCQSTPAFLMILKPCAGRLLSCKCKFNLFTHETPKSSLGTRSKVAVHSR